MIDYYLKFKNEADSIPIIEPLIPTHSIDVIGTIFEHDGVDPTLMVPIDGWHINVRGPEESSLAIYSIDVTSPVRIWA